MAINKVTVAIILVAFFVASNRLLFGLNTGELQDEHKSFIKPKDDVLNYYLEKHKKQIGDDYESYKNHCLRVLAFTRYFLSQDNITLEPRTYNIIAMALAYHDIALWTDGALDYLDPSVSQMKKRVTEEMQRNHQQEGDEAIINMPKILDWSSFLEEESEIATAIILQHHKLTSYTHKKNSADREDSDKGESKKNQSKNVKDIADINEIVNAVRKADWADATMGLVRFGLPQSVLGAAYEAIPEAGFHNVLLNMGGRLSPDSLVGQLDVLKILKF